MGERKGGALLRAAGLAGFLATALAAALYLYLRLPGIPDRDALYHFRHAAIYVERGPWYAEFPWTVYSAIRVCAADIWYGFHLLLTPFTRLGDPALGVKLSGAFCLALLLALTYGASRLSHLRFPFLWPFVILVFTPFSLYRLLMTRPQVVSMGLTAVLMACLVSGSIVGVALASFAICFVHLGFFWAIPLVVGVVVFVRRVTEESWAWRESAAALLGGLAGWALRPHPIGAAKLVYIQIVQLALEKQRGVNLLFGADLLPAVDAFQQHAREFAVQFAPGFLLWGGAVALTLVATGSGVTLKPRARTFLWSSLALSCLAVATMLRFSIRAIDLVAVFGVMLVAGTFTFLADPSARSATKLLPPRACALVSVIGALLVGFMVWRAIDEHARKMSGATYRIARFQQAAAWLAKDSRPEEIVFHAHWDLFPDLFLWNTKNRYIGGMDPIFQYAFDPKLYWKAHHLYTGRFASYTCGTPYCSPEFGEGTLEVLTRDFHASYLVLEKRRYPSLFEYASRDERLTLGFDEDGIAVFRLEAGGGQN